MTRDDNWMSDGPPAAGHGGGLVEMSPTIGSLIGALAKAQGAMGAAKKDSVNPHFRSKYADLASVMEAIRGPLSTNELAVLQTLLPTGEANLVCVVTTLGHSSGEWIRSRLVVPVSRVDAQGFGSAITYARRFGLMAIAGIAADDDDGESAVRAPPQPSPASPARSTSAPASPPSNAVSAFISAFQRLSVEGTKKDHEALIAQVMSSKLSTEERQKITPAAKDALTAIRHRESARTAVDPSFEGASRGPCLD